MKKLTAILGNSQRLDGGAMFGNVPKALWSRWMQPDEANRITLACRALLIQDGNKNILLETGIGAFFSSELKERYGVVESEHVLLENLNKQQLCDSDIDIIILSHLHFDHAGGLLSAYEEGTSYKLLFPKAKYLASKRAWERATHPHFRDRASFIPELNTLLEQSGRLHVVDSKNCELLGPDYLFHFSEGHTPGLMMTEIATEEGPLVFASDLIPGKPWVHLPITMGYDRFPEQVINEKEALLSDLAKRQGRLFYTHDPQDAFSYIKQDEKGKFVAV